MTAPGIDTIEEAAAEAEASIPVTALVPLSDVAPLDQDRLELHGKLYSKDEIIQGQFRQIASFKSELRKLDARLAQKEHELGRMRDILDGLNRDKHKFEQDVRKETRNQTNLTVTALFGARPNSSFPLIIALVIIIGFLSFLDLSSNSNVTSGLHSIEISPLTELMIILLIASVVIGYVYLKRRRH